jgi:uncharacterized protein (TIGR00730 family)
MTTTPNPAPWSLCVYCGSRSGVSPAHAEAARRTGQLLGERGLGLVYGGGRAGLMGTVADAALQAGAYAVGVIPESLMSRELGHRGLHELHVVQTMHQRKQMMAERADAFVALPGGIGTFEELFEVWTWRQLGYHDKPVGLLNTDGYYDSLLAFLDQAGAQGFIQPAQRELLIVENQPEALLDRLLDASTRASAPDDYRRI